MIYINYNAYLITTDVEKKAIKVINANDPREFIENIKTRVNYDPEEYWNQPCAVLKKKTDHPCYSIGKLLDW